MKAGINWHKSESFINTENKELYLHAACLAHVPCVKKIQPLIQAAWAMLGHGLGHAWQFGSLILTVIKILKLELLQR